jgi:hypothetical protein
MKRITIYQKGTANVELLDNDDRPEDEYNSELSSLFQSSNVTILKTSGGTFIGRPSHITGIVVEEILTDEITEDINEDEIIEQVEEDQPEDIVESDVIEEETVEKEIVEDIITDVD